MPGPLDAFERVTATDEAEARKLLVEEQPVLILAQADVAWHQSFLSALSAERRPATVVRGYGAVVHETADEWVVPEASREELEIRIRLALSRALSRKKTARRVYLDSLTGLPNRRALVRGLLREVARAKRQATPLSLVLMDLDGFKLVNDREGHPAGDRLLRKAGAALRRITRGNELCGRFGGDEFAIVISGDEAQAQQAAQRATHALFLAGAPGTAAACEMEVHESLKDFYRRADKKLQQAKERRRTLLFTNPTGRPAAVQVTHAHKRGA
jgi:diguanylate cyclase (GGDEF)-like protein